MTSCLSPKTITVRDSQGREMSHTIACRNCPPCSDFRKRQIAGQLLAEKTTSKDSYMVTLTYRTEGEGMRPYQFDYRTVQLFLKRLRKNNPQLKIRFACFGEKGEKRARVHWHLAIFTNPTEGKTYFPIQWGKAQEDGRQWIPEWPHGHINVLPLTNENARYTAKYAVKDAIGNKAAERWRFSAGRALGTDYIVDYAKRIAKMGAYPHNFRYSIDGITTPDGKKMWFFFMNKSLKRHFMRAYTETYRELWGKEPPGPTVEDYYVNHVDPDVPQDFRPAFQWTRYSKPWEDFMFEDYNLKEYFTNPIHVVEHQGLPLAIEIDKDENEAILTSEDETWRVSRTVGERLLRNSKPKSVVRREEPFRARNAPPKRKP